MYQTIRRYEYLSHKTSKQNEILKEIQLRNLVEKGQKYI